MHDEEIKSDLADCYQILAHLKMDDHTYTHIAARPKGADYYYIYPFGLRFEEVTTDNLIKASLDGQVLEGSEYQYNQTGYTIHGSIFRARPDLVSSFHLHTEATVAVSAMKTGLLPISQWALHFYNQIAYHDYNSLALDADSEGCRITRDLGMKKIMFMRNHGFLACGNSIHEALYYCYHLEKAAKVQCACGHDVDKLILPSPELCKKSNGDLLGFEKDLGRRDFLAWQRLLERQGKNAPQAEFLIE